MPDFVNLHAGEGAKFFSADQARQLKITNQTNATLYYKTTADVSSGSSDGNLTQGQSATFATGQWVIPTANCQLLIQYPLGTTQADITLTDDLTVGDDATIADDLTVTGDLAVTGPSALTGPVNFKRQVTNTGGVFATPIVLTEAQSGRVIMCNDAAGLDFTLPAITASNVGMHFQFVVTVTITSNSYRITAGAADLLKGGLWMVDASDATEPTGEFIEPNGSSNLVCTLGATTTGGLIGTNITYTAISATEWFVSGTVATAGDPATPFSG